jgi:hypothetical protein
MVLLRIYQPFCIQLGGSLHTVRAKDECLYRVIALILELLKTVISEN